jgi:hypothetical protein
LIVLIVGTLGLSLVRRTYSISTLSGAAQKLSSPNRSEEAKQHFPVAEYDEPELVDPAKNAAKKGEAKAAQQL